MEPEIRVVRPDDAGQIARIYATYVTETPISFDEAPPTADDIAHKIETILPKYPWLVAEVGGALAGYAYAGLHRDRAAYRWSTDVSVYIELTYHRRGIGSALYRRLFDILRAQNYFNAFAGITLPNAASVGLHESLGFTPIGRYEHVGFKFGRWHDTGWWQLVLRPHEDEPAEPIPFSEWQAARA